MLRLNGEPVITEAKFDLADRGLTLGDGLFETIPIFLNRPALLAEHLDRLQTAAAEIRLPLDRAMLEAEVAALVAGIDAPDAVIRLTVTRGAGARGLALPEDAKPAVIAAASPYPKGALAAPVRLATVSGRRNPTSFASRAKTLSYLDAVLAFDEAKRAGADDALMLNTLGRVASTSMANLFVLTGDQLVTPPVSEGVLPGIIRALVLKLAAGAGLAAVERPVEASELDAADAVFATNSVRLVTPVLSIDGRPIEQSEVVGRLSLLVRKECGAATLF